MIELTLDAFDESVIARKSDRIMAALKDEMNVLMLKLQNAIVETKLHGQVLHQRTGKLAASIRMEPATMEVSGDGVVLTGEVVGAGGVAWYGKLHEYGFGPYDYETTRHVKMHYGDLTFKKLAHSSGFPERSFMRSTLDEFQATIVDSLQATLNAAVAAE